MTAGKAMRLAAAQFAPWRRYVLALFRRKVPLIPRPPGPTSATMKAILAVTTLAMTTASGFGELGETPQQFEPRPPNNTVEGSGG
jgi:hypothetical protein